MGFLKGHEDKIYAVFRIFIGLAFSQHGFQKLFGLFGGPPDGAPAFMIYGAGAIELVGGLLVMAGLFAGPAAFICSGTMAVAYFIGHAVPNQHLLPIVNQGELAALYCFGFLLIAARGSGIWSADAARGSAGD
jgi:putative oxidoreductase